MFLLNKTILNILLRCAKFIGGKYDRLQVKPRDIEDIRIVMRMVKATVASSPFTLQEYFERNGFVWRADPLRGMLDYISEPEIVFVTRLGDCDDACGVWKYCFPFLTRYALLQEKAWKGGHVIGVGKMPDGMFLVTSNFKVAGVIQAADDFDAINKTIQVTFPNKTLRHVLKFSDAGLIDSILAVK